MTRRPALLNFINVILTLIIILLILAIVSLLWIITPMRVSGNSMQNTLQDNDIIWVQKVGYSLQKGDIIVFKRPGATSPPVKRIIATAGDTVQFDMEKGYKINGEYLDEDYLSQSPDEMYGEEYFTGSHQDATVSALLMTSGIIVGENQLFVLGDNRSVSLDSHSYGCIEISWIVGKVVNK
ncbi:MAG: signal peptidase I [Christensenellales bacterium]